MYAYTGSLIYGGRVPAQLGHGGEPAWTVSAWGKSPADGAGGAACSALGRRHGVGDEPLINSVYD